MTTTLDLDTFLVTVYCVLDEEYTTHFAARKPVRPGPAPEMADSEVLTVLALAQSQSHRSERRFVRYVGKHWRAYFPRLLSQSAFNRRARDLMPVLGALGPALHARLVTHLQATGAPAGAYEAFDGVPVPLLRRCRGHKHRLFADEASVGRGGSDHDWYYGVRLLGVASNLGTLTGFVVGPATTNERWLAEALLRWRHDPLAPTPTTATELAAVLGPTKERGGGRRGPTGPIAGRTGAGAPAPAPYLADAGFPGVAWQTHWRTDYGATVLTPAEVVAAAVAAAPPEEAPATTRVQARKAGRWHAGHRQLAETTFQWLTDTFGLAFPRAKTYQGLLTRLGAKVAAFNLGVYVNYLVGRPTFAFFNPVTD